MRNTQREFQRQVGRLVDLGLHRVAGLSADDYVRRFVPFDGVPRPRFPLLLVVDPLIGLADLHRALGVKEAADSAQLATDAPHGAHEAAAPYVIWTHDGARYSGKAMNEARRGHGEEVGCTQLEVSFLFAQYPEVFRGRGIDAELTVHAGKREYHSTLIWVQDPPELALHHENDRTAGLGVLTRAR